MAEQSRPSLADHLFPIGMHYYTGVVENAEELTERCKLATQCTLGVRTSTMKADPCSTGGKESHDEATCKEGLLATKKLYISQ